MICMPTENLTRLYMQMVGYHYRSAESIANGSATIGTLPRTTVQDVLVAENVKPSMKM